MITQNDYNIIKQRFQTRYIKINVLNFNYQIVDEISGNLLECSFNIDATSDIRRTCNVSLIVYGKNAKKLTVGTGNEIWLDKYVQPFVGIENSKSGEIQWYNQGIYLINRPSYDFDASTNTLKFEGIDLASKLTSVRNGQLEGVPTIIPAESNVREAIIGAIELGGFTRYICSECKNTDGTIQNVPAEIKLQQGSTIWDIITNLRDILPNYQTYFDIDGVFHYEPIPTGSNMQITMDDDLLSKVLISESINTNFDEVKNYIEVYGKSHNVKYYPTTISISGSQINLTIESVESLTDYLMIGFTPTTTVSGNISIKVNSFNSLPLVDSANNAITSLNANEYYVALYKESNQNWLFLGHQQAKAIAYDNNPESPFYINGTVGKIRHVCVGGEYENIQSDELALERAKYELYIRARLNDNISFYTIPIPWLDVNMIVQHKKPNDTDVSNYLIQTISWGTGVDASMSIVANKVYPDYPVI